MEAIAFDATTAGSVAVHAPFVVPAGDALIGRSSTRWAALSTAVFGSRQPHNRSSVCATSVGRPVARQANDSRPVCSFTTSTGRSCGAARLLESALPRLPVTSCGIGPTRECAHSDARVRGGSRLTMARAHFEVADSSLAGAPRSLPRCIAIEPAPGAEASAGWLVPRTAIAIASAFRSRGHHAFILSRRSRCVARDASFSTTSRTCDHAALAADVPVLRHSSRQCHDDELSRRQSCCRGSPRLSTALSISPTPQVGLPLATTKLVRPPIKVADKRTLGYVMLATAAQRRAMGDAILLDPKVRRTHDDGERDPRKPWRYRPQMSLDPIEQLITLLAVITLQVPVGRVSAFLQAFSALLHDDPLLAMIRARREITAADHDAITALARTVFAPTG